MFIFIKEMLKARQKGTKNGDKWVFLVNALKKGKRSSFLKQNAWCDNKTKGLLFLQFFYVDILVIIMVKIRQFEEKFFFCKCIIRVAYYILML